MSLFSTKEAGKGGKLGIWHISESLDELLNMKTFSKADLSMLTAFSYEQRKKEWLAARILTEELTGEKDVQILYDEYGKPTLLQSNPSGKKPKNYISLSHSHDLLAVILDVAETGVDIELIKQKIEGIKHKFMNEAELKSLQKEKQEEQLTVYWCAKESLYKLYGKKELTFKENLLIEPFQYSGKGIIQGRIKNAKMNKCFSLQYEKLSPTAIGSGKDNYMMAYIINQD